jgi:transcriptional regulator with XRE-family HTH domain
MTSVGATLRSARESQGRVLAEIAEELCVTQRYLRAIEADDLKVLPGIFFYKSFVKQYAAALNIDPKQFHPALSALDPQPETAVKEVPRTTATPVSIPLTMAAAAAGFGRFAEQSSSDPSYRPPVRTLDPLVEEGNRDYFTDRKVGVSVAALVFAVLLCTGFYVWWNRPHAVVQRDAKAAPVRTVVNTPPVAPPTVDVTEHSDGIHVALNLSATEATWLSITTSDGKEIFSGVLEPSQTKTLTGLDVAKMKVGNAGGIEVLWNGKPIGPIGPRGQVRTVMFTPQNFEIMEPPAPAPKTDADPAL